MIIDEKYRPRLHYSPRAGWMNDPNGLIYIDGVWHAFYQHDPGSVMQWSMHWGHATSTDLVHWQEQPVALYPDELGTCFSGSAIETPEGGVKLFYTAHQRIDGGDYQTQCLVHADRSLTRFTSDPGNPIIDNPGLSAFRDPKVIWHAASRRWIMVVTHGQSIGFYSSADLFDWRFESTFGEHEGRHGDGPWECPDLFPMEAPDGSIHWVLIVGIGSDAYGGGSGTQYFLGAFDGQKFTNFHAPHVELWLDYGRDFYAAQSFSGLNWRTPTLLAWASNWQYAQLTPLESFRGSLSLPRRLELAQTPAGLRLSQSVPRHVTDAFDTLPLTEGPIFPSSGTYRLATTTELEPGESLSIALFGDDMPQARIERVAGSQYLLHIHRRERLWTRVPIPHFGSHYSVPFSAGDKVDIELFVDNGLVELSLAGGTVWSTNLHFPLDCEGAVTVSRGIAAAAQRRA